MKWDLIITVSILHKNISTYKKILLCSKIFQGGVL